MTNALPEALVSYLAQRDTARADAVTALLGSLTDRERALIKEAAAMGYTLGQQLPQGTKIHRDREIMRLVLNACLAQPDAHQAITNDARYTERDSGLFHDASVMGYVQGMRYPTTEGPHDSEQILFLVVDACLSFQDLYRTLTGYAPTPLCAECDHAEDEHEEGDDPVTPGTCAACDDDEDRHDFRPADGVADEAQQPEEPTR
ncbi:hypothetical protein [Streptomyces sp. NPDC005969]|uniref:hypothetical protein n=1 Tax=Streptomyces sp. NPDC005969 TaxID=3156722 RepID=UPI0033E49A7D